MPLREKSREPKPGWSFGEEADYAKDGPPRWELIAALAVVAVWVVLGFRNDGPGAAVQTFGFYLVPLAMIWRPDVLGRIGAKVDPLWRADHPTPRLIVRMAGWVWLFFPLLVNGFAMLFRSQLK